MTLRTIYNRAKQVFCYMKEEHPNVLMLLISVFSIMITVMTTEAILKAEGIAGLAIGAFLCLWLFIWCDHLIKKEGT